MNPMAVPWEQCRVYMPYADTNPMLADMGRMGWELVAVLYSREGAGYDLFFKRPKQEQ